MNISQKIHNLRIENGYSQEELAEKLNVPSRYIAYWEDGVTPELSVIVKLSNIFNVSTDYLLKDDVDSGVSKEVEEEVEEIQVEQTEEELLQLYIQKRNSRGETFAYGVLCAIWAIIPLLSYSFDIFVIFDFTEEALLKILSIIIFGILAFFAVACFVGNDTRFDNMDFSNLIFDTSKENKLKQMYKNFKTENQVPMITSVSIDIIAIIVILVVDPLYYRDFESYLIADIALFFFSCATCAIINIKTTEATYKKILNEIEEGAFNEKENYEIQHVEEINEVYETVEVQEFSQGEEVQEIRDDNTNSDTLKIETYMASKTKQAKNIYDGIGFIFFSTITVAFSYYGLLESIHNEDLHIYTYLLMNTIKILFPLIGLVYLILAFKTDTTLELNQNGTLVLNRTEKAKFDETYIMFKKDISRLLVREIVVFIAIALIGNITIGVFDMGNFMRFIVLDVLIVFIGCIIGTFVSTRVTNNGYKTVMNYVGEVRINKYTKAGHNKRGIKILDSTGADEYLNNRIRNGKNYGTGLIFLALGIAPLILYFYRNAKIFNSLQIGDSPEIILATSIVCSLIAICFLAKSSYTDRKFKTKNNNEYILNEFAENKLKFMYEKFKSRRIGKTIFSIVIYASAIISTTYLVLMFKDNHYKFNGTPYMFYGLFGVTTFLYAFATYFIITIKYEQGAYKTLLKNVLD